MTEIKCLYIGEMKLRNICVCRFSRQDVTCSREWHVGGLSSIPAGVLGWFLELDQLTKTCLHNHALFLAFIEQLLLSSSQSFIRSTILSLLTYNLQRVFLSTIFPDHILCSCVNALIWFSIHESRIKSWPCGHQVLFLICTNTNNNINVNEHYSITQSSYSIKWFKHGVVSNTGGIDTGALIKPINDIFNYNIRKIINFLKLSIIL